MFRRTAVTWRLDFRSEETLLRKVFDLRPNETLVSLRFDFLSEKDLFRVLETQRGTGLLSFRPPR